MLIKENDCLLLIIDLQEKLLRHIHNQSFLINKSEILIKTFNKLSLPIIITEQYPKGLGKTDPRILSSIDEYSLIEKTSFSCAKDAKFTEQFKSFNKSQIIICGIETHICILQSAFDLLSKGYSLFIVSDAVGSRHINDTVSAIERMNKRNINLVTTEMVIFELLGNSKNDHFKYLSGLVK